LTNFRSGYTPIWGIGKNKMFPLLKMDTFYDSCSY
jgi:hypothetical protein